MFCAKCGAEVPDEHSFCTKCGSAVPQAPPMVELQKVSRSRTILLVLYLIFVTWVGSAGIAYGVVELTGGGPQGEQGEQGPKGARGASGPAGSSGSVFDTNFSLERLAGMWAVNIYAQYNPGETISGSDPRVQACIDYIMDGTGSFVECGFTR